MEVITENLGIFIPVIVTLLSVLGVMATARSANRKVDREGADAISQAAVRLIKPLEERLDSYIKENEELRRRIVVLEQDSRELETLRFENRHLKQRVRQLEQQVAALLNGTR